jgi:hypothetical protein
MGNVHRYGDRRMPAPGILGLIAAAAASVLAAVAGHPAESVTAGVAFLLLVGWVVLYLRISAPINRLLTAAADAHETVTEVDHLLARLDHAAAPALRARRLVACSNGWRGGRHPGHRPSSASVHRRTVSVR